MISSLSCARSESATAACQASCFRAASRRGGNPKTDRYTRDGMHTSVVLTRTATAVRNPPSTYPTDGRPAWNAHAVGTSHTAPKPHAKRGRCASPRKRVGPGDEANPVVVDQIEGVHGEQRCETCNRHQQQQTPELQGSPSEPDHRIVAYATICWYDSDRDVTIGSPAAGCHSRIKPRSDRPEAPDSDLHTVLRASRGRSDTLWSSCGGLPCPRPHGPARNGAEREMHGPARAGAGARNRQEQRGPVVPTDGERGPLGPEPFG
jgi:hypothetical protein